MGRQQRAGVVRAAHHPRDARPDGSPGSALAATAAPRVARGAGAVGATGLRPPGGDGARERGPGCGCHPLSGRQDARPLPPHRQPGVGPARPRDRGPRRPDLLGVAGIALGADLVLGGVPSPGRIRRARLIGRPGRTAAARRRLAGVVVREGRHGVPVHRRGQRLLLWSGADGDVPRHAGRPAGGGPPGG